MTSPANGPRRVSNIGKREVVLEVIERLRLRESVPDLWLCPALLKKDRFDSGARKGNRTWRGQHSAAHHPPLRGGQAQHGPRPHHRHPKAAEQCARTALPALVGAGEARCAAGGMAGKAARCSSPMKMAGEPAAAAFAAQTGPAAILTGPEGGFDDAERRRHPRAPPAPAPSPLGPRILRGETAAIAALAVWMAQAGDW